jgi:hypothetical protein
MLCDAGQRNVSRSDCVERIAPWKNVSRFYGPGYYKRVWIDVLKLDAMLQIQDNYVGFAGENGIHDRYSGVDEFVWSGKPLSMPQVRIHRGHEKGPDERVYFWDGRHRFAWMRDHGALALPVAALADEAVEIARLVGTKTRICRVTMEYIPEYIPAWLSNSPTLTLQ